MPASNPIGFIDCHGVIDANSAPKYLQVFSVLEKDAGFKS